MSWQEFSLARQLLTEEAVGTAAREAVADEDAAFASALDNVKRRER